MIVLIDNYDSFSYNLYQLLAELAADAKAQIGEVCVLRNDALSVSELAARSPQAIVLSPGPGRPDAAGICEDVVRKLSGTIPILGVCLGHQAICEAFGGTIVHASQLMHGKSSETMLDASCPLFAGLGSHTLVGRYHSLAADFETLPPVLRVVAHTETGEIMAVCHRSRPTYGLQFHPESILTPQGPEILKNFLEVVADYHTRKT